MEFYDLIYVVEDKYKQKLSVLAERYKKIIDWNEKDMLQFAVAATSSVDIEMKLYFLERILEGLEKEYKKEVLKDFD